MSPTFCCRNCSAHGLRTSRLGRSLYHFYSVDSTNAFAMRLLAHGRSVPDGTLILAESQTAGRGRMGRTWHSEPESGLYLSLVLRPAVSPGLAPLFTLACAVALHDAVERNTRLDVDIKWPNDLLVGRKKVAGILAEIQADLDRIHFLVIGAGLNVNHKSSSRRPCRSRDIVAPGFRPSIIRGSRFFSIFWSSLRRSSIAFSRKVPKLSSPNGLDTPALPAAAECEISDGLRTAEGMTSGLNSFGALRVETASGRIEEVYSGEVREWE